MEKISEAKKFIDKRINKKQRKLNFSFFKIIVISFI